MEKLLIIQADLYDKLKKHERNFKKSPKDRIKISYLETRLASIEELWQDFKTGHRKIIAEATRELKLTNVYFTEDTYDGFEELYTSYKTDLKEALLLLTKQQEPPEFSNRTKQAEVKLPRIQLPTFSGKYNEWQTFYDMFTSLINNNNNLTPVQKLHYLKSSLTGEPENLLRNFSTTDQNYLEAWKQLVKRYNNKRYNCNAIMKTLFTQKSINHESASAIRQLLDTTSSCLKALGNIGIDTTSWDTIVIYLVVSKLDTESHKQWENQLALLTEDLPTWTQLVDFLEARFRSMEMIDTGKQVTKSVPKSYEKPKSFHSSLKETQTTHELKCLLCDGQHYLYNCKKFGQQSTQERQEFVQSKGLCFNCLVPHHSVKQCRQTSCCRRCGRRHHSLLHFEKEENQGPTSNTESAHREPHRDEKKQPTPSTPAAVTKVVANFSKGAIHTYNVLLATAVIRASSRSGTKYSIRALLDQGSQASFVTESTVQLLGLKRIPVNGLVSGLGDGQTRVKHMVSLHVESRHSPNNTIQVNAYVLSSLTSLLPAHEVQSPDWLVLNDLDLADPGYTTPGKIDILLGAEVYGEIILSGMIKNPERNLIAQNTILGWVISGKLSRIASSSKEGLISMHLKMREDDLLKQFWALESEPNSIHKEFTQSENRCEEIYDNTTTRQEDGRFVVKLPFKNNDPACQYGQSKDIAAKKLAFLEKRLNKTPTLYMEYNKVLEEYIALNHMQLVEENEIENPKAVYLPHHAVVRNDKETTKVRIVFNASSKGANDVSLNDDLLVGPKLQQDLRHLLMRWRSHPICIVADLVKMYRQVRVTKEDTNFQRILWRCKSDEPLKHYKLLTLTFGTACAPYLAVKTLQRLAEEEQSKFPKASEITKTDYYIDDLMTGCFTESEAIEIYEEMNGLMNSGGFQLQKWSSNNHKLLEYISTNEHNIDQSVSIPIKGDNLLKVLGLRWNNHSDNFEYTVNLPESTNHITKRQILSDIARLYDPMGWIAPVVMSAKLIIQKLWKANLDWDDEPSEELVSEWLKFREELTDIKNILIPRWIRCTRECEAELHAFSDASKVAYAASVYIRVIDADDKIYVTLITAKTKVAPIDKEVSIPRLELCGAVLAAKLLHEVSQVMNVPKTKLYAWTDSTVVLAWLKGPPSRWATFVSNRVSDILTILDYEQWGHVSTNTNPADCASRGLRPAELQSHALWWRGPQWLLSPTFAVEKTDIPETHEEERVTSLTALNRTEDFLWTKFSSLLKMLRIMSYCRRILNFRKPKNDRKELSVSITTKETNQMLQICIKQVQDFEFGEDIKQLKLRGFVQKKSVLHTLCPILDQNGILRVGGRIDQANVSYDKKHPIIIPAKSHLAKLLILDAHRTTLHGGPQVMLNFLRSKYWILRARDQVKKQYRECVTCLRHSKINRIQLMGQLPASRLRPSKPFKSAGVDYAGPINIKFSPGRGAKSYKGYICLFVCMVTRAIHLEAVTDLTAKGFIAAFRRFTSRRGHCKDLFSDNGTNFVGADKQLRQMLIQARKESPNELVQLLSLEATNWHFIPPHAPNFGGIWEAGVRCVKSHLKRVVGESMLTYEELSTVLTQIEACLNSRPLTVLSDNPDDPLPLTPGHFLVGEPLLNIPDEDHSDQKLCNLERWKFVQKMVSDFWKRWSKEYLVSLNQRYKWNTKLAEPNINDVVVVKEDNVPPCKWILGKIVDKHTGHDNVTRVVTIKCKNGYLKRPLSKLTFLTK